MARLAPARDLEATTGEELPGILDHLRVATQHDARTVVVEPESQVLLQHEVIVVLPGLELVEYRQERGQPRSRGEHPQVAPRFEAVGSEEAVALPLDEDRVAFLQAREAAGEGAARHDDGEELEVLVV